jgi:tetratricopeptide (TPR) repeat protein
VEQTTTARIERARYLIDLRRWDEALSELGAVLAVEPDSLTGLCLRAQCQIGSAQPDAACETAELAMALAPDDEWPHRIRSVALGMLGRHEEAVAEARETVRLDPDATSFLRLAKSLWVTGELDEAQDAIDRALTLDPEWSRAHRLAGDIAESQGNLDKAREAYERALELDPEDAEPLQDLARLANNQMQLDAALRHGKASLALDPHDPQTREYLDVMVFNVATVPVLIFMLTAPLFVVGAAAEVLDLIGGPWLPLGRAVAGLACIAAGIVVVARWLRQLPPGLRLHLRTRHRRIDAHDVAKIRWVLIPTTVLFLATAFGPALVALVTGALIIVIFLAARSGLLLPDVDDDE